MSRRLTPISVPGPDLATHRPSTDPDGDDLRSSRFKGSGGHRSPFTGYVPLGLVAAHIAGPFQVLKATAPSAPGNTSTTQLRNLPGRMVVVPGAADGGKIRSGCVADTPLLTLYRLCLEPSQS